MSDFLQGDLVDVKHLGQCKILEVHGECLNVSFKDIQLAVYTKDVTLKYRNGELNRLYKKVYDELPQVLLVESRRYSNNWPDAHAIVDAHATILATAAIGYFAKLICGQECPGNSLANAINTIVFESKNDYEEV